MALSTSYDTYPPTQLEFINHWTLTNAARGSAFVLNNGQTVATLTAQRTNLMTAITNATNKAEIVVTLSVNRTTLRETMRAQMDEFRRAAAYRMAGKPYATKIAPLPKVSTSDEAYGKAGDTYKAAWLAYNADTSVPAAQRPLVLSGNVNLAGFTANVLNVRNSLSAVNMAEQVATTARKQRDALLLPTRQTLTLYKQAILALYPPTSTEVQTLPRLWEQTTVDPTAVKLKVTYTPGATTAKLSWNQVTDPSVTRLTIFVSPGARYKESAARSIGDVEPTILEFIVPVGVITPGSTNWFKVASIGDDAHQALSNAVKVVREV